MNLFRCFAISFALSFAAACSSGPGTDFKVASPDGTLCVGIRAADSLTYTVTRHGTPVLLPSAIGLHFADGTVLGRGAKVTDARRETVERVVEAPFYRQARFTEHYNQLRLTFEGGYAVTFRVFDQGCAYRIETHLPGERTVAGEVAEFNFAGDPGLFAAYSDGLCNAYQSQYEKCRLSALGTEKPVLLRCRRPRVGLRSRPGSLSRHVPDALGGRPAGAVRRPARQLLPPRAPLPGEGRHAP